MNLCYRTVWNSALGAHVAAAENVPAKRGGKASGSRRTATASAALALAALAAGGVAQAATFTAASEAELITAINDANASPDLSSTITVTKAITVTTTLPQLSSKVTVNTGTFATTIGSAAGATLDLQTGATYQAAAVQVGTVANTTGSVVAQGSGTTLSGTTLTTGAGQSTISILKGASAVFTGNLTTGAGSATINVGTGASVSADNLNSGTGHTTVNVTGGGTITLGTNANLGGGNGAANGGITDVVVSGTGSALQFTGASGYYHHAGTLEVSDGGFVGANTVQLGFRAGDVFTATVTGAKTVFGSVNNNLSFGGAGTATVTVADGAKLTSGTNGTNPLFLANSATGVATLNIGAPVGSAPVAPGVVTASGITSSAGQSTINFNHNASNYEFAVPVGGTVAVNQIGSGTTALTGANTYTGGTTITAGTLQLGNGGTTGSIGGNVVNNATLAINHSNAFGFAGAISGGGVLQQLGAGTTTLTGTNTYTGGTVVQAGRLLAGSAGAFVQNTAYTVNGGTLDLGTWDLTASSLSGTGGTVALNARTLTVDQAGDSTYAGAITGTGGVVKSGAGVLTLSGTNSYSGTTSVTQGTLRAGAVNTFSSKSATVVGNGATLDLAGRSQTLASVNNSGTVSLAGTTPGTTLTVTGPWVGNGGTLRLGTALGDSSSASDKLVLSGATAIASGATNVQVTNLGGLGALTTGNGIEVISAINGATTTAQTTKNAFALSGGHVDAGAYEYRLYAADANGAGENWYLRSTVAAVPPVNAGGSGVVVPAYRAEVPLYAVLPEQFRQANLSMLGSLHIRMGDSGRPATNDAGPAIAGQSYRQAWGRVISTDRTTSQTGTVSPTSEGRLTGFQAGTDLWADAHWRAGVYVGQLDGDMRVNGFASGLLNLGVGTNDLKNQYFGVYGTWKNDGGLYVDGVLQGGRHRYTASPTLGLASSGKGSSLLASIEVGQPFGIAAGWTIEPQLQLVHQRVSLDDTGIVGALIRQDSHDGWLVRAGVRVKGEIDTSAGLLQPYARLNLYHSGGGTDVARFTGPAGFADIATRTGGSSGELAVGASWQLSRSTSLYGELGQLWDMSGDARNSSGVNASVGVKVLW
ncbi:autotransporter outer membrane beta-barrel domain-containing protein [Variovorax sp. NFACC27]|uniref:autotransporter outer membrane beta-barrel domain-containing protein n=1 Tax=unclassified Variovorax TaxID=663243 RepID=UPI00089D7881|nr:outer membrane autotransporter barrel domain-containing protein [Variovorax sp. NFACC28]SEG87304.1 outer membrane autotransporter barrel domain-containing protein [Variovorax sp. NFACC29]SFD29184.1 outer membrane autotransporter barrel domain-containing protein [Variovorax sp. NFACC26]SFG33364.1 outer membrane autotransporter barrel domain-containing protein [Variovorax sp. NFACC27]